MSRPNLGGELRPIIDTLHTWEHLAGVDLHGLETLPTHPDTAAVWARLRAAGKVTKCHAGEFDGPARVREAIRNQTPILIRSPSSEAAMDVEAIAERLLALA